MNNSMKKFRTKLSTQFAAFTTMLIAITVFCIAWYSIATVNNLATQITKQSKELNDSISITLFQTLGALITPDGNMKRFEISAQVRKDLNMSGYIEGPDGVYNIGQLIRYCQNFSA